MLRATRVAVAVLALLLLGPGSVNAYPSLAQEGASLSMAVDRVVGVALGETHIDPSQDRDPLSALAQLGSLESWVRAGLAPAETDAQAAILPLGGAAGSLLLLGVVALGCARHVARRSREDWLRY